MDSLGDVLPVLTTASRAERATIRAARDMARREAERHPAGAPGLDDGLAMSPKQHERLTGCHRTSYRAPEWSSLAARGPRQAPARAHEREAAAQLALEAYQPSWQERLFGQGAKRRRRLAAKVAEAAAADEAAFHKACRDAEARDAESRLARRLLQLRPDAIREALVRNSGLAEVSEPMNGVGLALPGAGRIVAVVDGLQLDDLPQERVPAGGARSDRELIPPRERRELHRASVCAAALRTGAEFVSALPVPAVEVVVECGGVAVLQLLMPQQALAALDWRKGDAVALAGALGARMDWSGDRGFAPIRPVPMSAMGAPLARIA